MSYVDLEDLDFVAGFLSKADYVLSSRQCRKADSMISSIRKKHGMTSLVLHIHLKGIDMSD